MDAIKYTKIKELKWQFMHWCDECDAKAYDYYNPCSGYQQEKCQEEKREWFRQELKKLEGMETYG